MARPLRIEFEGAVYHITSRGNAGQQIFLDDRDRQRFLDLLDSAVERYQWLCHAYCMMNNHYHLLIETPKANISRGMRHLNGVYTQYFNYRHSRYGHLLQGRFKAILVQKDTHLLELCRYIVLNPVRAGLVKNPVQWRWSNYAATTGWIKAPHFLTTDWTLSQFSGSKNEAQARYGKFVCAGAVESPWTEVKGRILLGTDEFVEKLKDFLTKKESAREIPKVERYVNRPSLQDLFNRKGQERDCAVYEAYARHGYSMSEIARHLGVHYTTVSRAIRRVEQK